MKNLIYILMVLLSISCSTEPQPIVYGRDACNFCEMIIVDRAFASRAVTDKGKQYKYDAIECLVNDLHQHKREMVVIQVSDYSNPGKMIGVEQVEFVQNDSINSPMGGNLAALKEGSTGKNDSGKLFSWEELKSGFLQENASVTNHR